jgi:hypothetical protein
LEAFADLAGEGFEEFYQGLFFLFGELEGADFGVFGFAFVVVFYDCFEVWRAAVVEVGGGLGDLAEAGGFDAFFLGFGVDAGLVEFFVGQVGAEVTGDAVGFAAEELEAFLLLEGEGVFVAGEVLIVGRVAGEDGADVGGQGLGEFGGVDGFIVFELIELFEGFVEREGHFYWVCDGLEDLIFESGGAAVPEKFGAPGAVENAGGAAGTGLVVDADGLGIFVGEGVVGIVAGGAGEGVVFGETFVEEELAAEADGVVAEGVIGGRGDVGIEAERDLEGEEEKPHHAYSGYLFLGW